MELMDYLQKYKESICYEASGMLPKPLQIDDKNDLFKTESVLKAEEIWPIVKSGP